MPFFADLAYWYCVVHFGDFVQCVVDRAMGKRSDKYAPSIFHEQARKVGEHKSLACTWRSLDKVQQIGGIGHCHGLNLAFIETGVL